MEQRSKQSSVGHMTYRGCSRGRNCSSLVQINETCSQSSDRLSVGQEEREALGVFSLQNFHSSFPTHASATGAKNSVFILQLTAVF